MTATPPAPHAWRATLQAAALGALLVWVMTAPTLTSPASVGRLDTNDGRYAIWNVAWVAHALTTDPRQVFDANIFHPHRGTLAYSEMNLVAGALAVPWYVWSGDPLVASNGAIAVALWLAFVLMAHLVRRLSGSAMAGLVAATAFTFCPYVAARTPHVQLLMIFVFPLVMIACHRLVEVPSLRRGIELGASLALAALACGYYGLFAGCLLGIAGFVFARRDVRYWTAFLVAALTAAVLVGPLYVAFLDARAASGEAPLRWLPSHAREYSASLSAYLASGTFAHSWWLDALARLQPWKDVLFPGALLIVLAAAGMRRAWSTAERRRLAIAYGLMGLTAFWASFGPDGGLYLVAYHLIPGMTLIRAPARLGIVVVFVLAVFAGFAVARLHERWRWMPLVLVCLLVAELGVRTEQWGWPSWPLRERPPMSAADRYLAQVPRGAVLEFPFPYVRNDLHNHARAMFWSSYHWQPLVNGYSDLIPPDFAAIARPINQFPDPASFAIAKARHVRYVLWRIERYDEPSRQVLRQRLEAYENHLMPLVIAPDGWLYQITRWPDEPGPP